MRKRSRSRRASDLYNDLGYLVMEDVEAVIRTRLTADTTFYVRTDGSDSNDGLSDNAAGAWLTPQHAIDTLNADYDCAGFVPTIQCRSGTYSQQLVLRPVFGAEVAPIILGDETTPSNVVFTNPSGANPAVDALVLPMRWVLRGIKITQGGTGPGLRVSGGCVVRIGKCEFGACGGAHILVQTGGLVDNVAGTTFTISGNATRHWSVLTGGKLQITSVTITTSGTPAFSSAFVYVDSGDVTANGITFSGTGATGQRYNVNMNGTIQTNGGGANYFPGNAAGATATGGQYA